MAKNPVHNSFLDGNEIIEAAIEKFSKEQTRGSLISVINSIRKRMHADGHFFIPVEVDEKDHDNFGFRTIVIGDGRVWYPAFTSQEEFEKGGPSQVISNFIDQTLNTFKEISCEGIIINPFGNSFKLTKPLIDLIFKADDGVEYTVPDVKITKDLLEDGSFLKRAAGICARNLTELNMFKLLKVLRDSYVWMPCDLDLGDETQKDIPIEEYLRVGAKILKNGGKLFFPVFSAAGEMEKSGDASTAVKCIFMSALSLAMKSREEVSEIVINPFTEPFVVDREFFGVLEEMESSIKE